MIKTKILWIVSFYFLLLNFCANAQLVLPRSSPEAEGVSSEEIISFLDAAAKSKHEFHSIMILRHGKVILEKWWSPYRPELKHTMYSLSKSFTATAVGFAVAEKRLTLTDKVVSFFPNDLPDTLNPFLSALTVRDVLSMSIGQEPDPTFTTVVRDSNWVKGFLATPVKYNPGTKFLYNSLGTYILSAIVQKVTGEKIIDYLRPRLFEPLGIQGMDWEIDPRDINTGGWGLRLKTEDMAKFGQLFLSMGNWNGKQILPRKWIEEASTFKIAQDPGAPQAKKDSSDWLQGYCYQMWRCRFNAFRGDGAYGQFVIVMPEQDAVIAITAETPDMQGEINLVWDYLLPAMKKDKAALNGKAISSLKEKLPSLDLSAPEKTASSSIEKNISGKTFTIDANEKHIGNLLLEFKDGQCSLTLKTDTVDYRLNFGSGRWQEGETTRHGSDLLMKAKANLVGLPSFKVDGAYNWKNDTTLELRLRYIESPHTETFICRFDNNNIAVEMKNSFNGEKLVLNGRMD